MSKYTRATYASVKKEYLAVVNHRKLTEAICSEERVKQYFTYLKRTGNAASTMHNKFRVMSSLYEQLLPSKPNYFKILKQQLPRPRAIRPTKSVLHSDVAVLISSIPDLQERTIVALMFYTGIRRSELVALNMDSVHPAHLILPHTKYGEEQIQALPSKARQYLEAYMPYREHLNEQYIHSPRSDRRALFVTERRGMLTRMSAHKVYRIFKKYCRVAPHAARATAATLLKAKGVDDRDVAKFLRHSSTAMVQVYDKRTNVEGHVASLMDY